MRRFCFLLSAAIAALPVAVRAEEPAIADFYRGKAITLIVSTIAGSSYDLMSRTIAKYLPRHLPGAPAIVVRNQPGAGGIAAVNALFHSAARDGTVIAGVQGSVPFEPMLGTKEADFDPQQFNWLGSPSSETCVMTVRAGAAATDVAGMRAREITMGSSGANSNPSFYARLINSVLGTKLRLVFGYPGQPDVFLAMDKGEVDGHPCVFWSALGSTRPQWLTDGAVRFPLQYGLAPEMALPETPFLRDLVTDPDNRRLVDAAQAPLALGRPYVAPPGVPAARVAALREAFERVFDDAEFLTETQALNLAVNARQTGPQMADLIARTYATPKALLDRLRALSKQE